MVRSLFLIDLEHSTVSTVRIGFIWLIRDDDESIRDFKQSRFVSKFNFFIHKRDNLHNIYRFGKSNGINGRKSLSLNSRKRRG